MIIRSNRSRCLIIEQFSLKQAVFEESQMPTLGQYKSPKGLKGTSVTQAGYNDTLFIEIVSVVFAEPRSTSKTNIDKRQQQKLKTAILISEYLWILWLKSTNFENIFFFIF